MSINSINNLGSSQLIQGNKNEIIDKTVSKDKEIKIGEKIVDKFEDLE